MVSKRVYGDMMPGLNLALGAALMESLGSPWRLVSQGTIRSFSRNTVGAMQQWIKGKQIEGQAVQFLPPEPAEGGHRYLIARLPLGASPAALRPPPQYVIVSDDFTCMWRLVEPVERAKAERMIAGIIGDQGKSAIGEPVPLPGTMVIRHNGRGLAQRFAAALMPPLKIAAYHFHGDRLAVNASPEAPLTVDASAIDAAPMTWLWPNVIPAGALTLLGGAAGMGKSQVAIGIAAAVSSGHPWPTGEQSERGSALVLEAEDDLSRTVKPRLIAAGGDPRRVGLAKSIDLRDGPAAFEAEHQRRGDLRLIVLSPIRKFIGDGEHYGNTGVRNILSPILDWAEEKQVAILGICHPPKNQQNKEAFAGSAAFLEVARAAYSVLTDDESKERIVKRRPRILVTAKGNLGPDNLRLNYRIDGMKTAEGIETSRVVWLGDLLNA